METVTNGIANDDLHLWASTSDEYVEDRRTESVARRSNESGVSIHGDNAPSNTQAGSKSARITPLFVCCRESKRSDGWNPVVAWPWLTAKIARLKTQRSKNRRQVKALSLVMSTQSLPLVVLRCSVVSTSPTLGSYDWVRLVSCRVKLRLAPQKKGTLDGKV